MLTADLARVRRRRGELRIIALDGRSRARAAQLAGAFLEAASRNLGRSRAEFEEACAGVPTRAAERKLADGLRKLVEDRCRFDLSADIDPPALRGELFLAASEAVRRLDQGERFDRGGFLAEQARGRNMDAAGLERVLYADLKSEQVLAEFAATSADNLVRDYEAAQAQAVLLRAVRVTALVCGADAYAYRALFRKLKFLRLLYAVHVLPDGGYRLEIDGPYSLFSSVSKYGLQLALALPAIQACGRHEIRADLRWGKRREPLVFRLQGRAAAAPATGEPALPDEVQALLERLRARRTPWRVEPCSEILDLPGVGLCIPDLRFVHRDTGEVAFLEVMGFWSRDAVWRRVELVQAGLPYRVLFAVSSRLRVSEAVLDEDLPGELYVYKGAMSAAEVVRRLDDK